MSVCEDPRLLNDPLWWALQELITVISDWQVVYPHATTGRLIWAEPRKVEEINRLACECGLATSSQPILESGYSFGTSAEDAEELESPAHMVSVYHPLAERPLSFFEVTAGYSRETFGPAGAEQVLAYLRAWQRKREDQLLPEASTSSAVHAPSVDVATGCQSDPPPIVNAHSETAPSEPEIPNPSAPHSLKEIAQAWGGNMTPRKLSGLIKSGKIPARRITRQSYEVSLDVLSSSAKKKLAPPGSNRDTDSH